MLLRYILDYMVLKRRQQYLALLLKGHLTVPVEFIQTELGFSSEKECLKFLYENNAVMRYEEDTADGSKVYVVDCKKSTSSSSGSSGSSSNNTAGGAGAGGAPAVKAHGPAGNTAHTKTSHSKSQPTTPSSQSFTRTITFSHGKTPVQVGSGGKHGSGGSGRKTASSGSGSKTRDRGPIIIDSALLAVTDSSAGSSEKKKKKSKQEKKKNK
jgi:hypothetical protein